MSVSCTFAAIHGMEVRPNNVGLEAAISEAVIMAGIITLKTVGPDVNTALVPQVAGTEFIEETMLPWPSDL